MADFKLTERNTETQQSKGQISTQSYLGNTVRSVTTVPPGKVEVREQVGSLATTSTVTKGDVRETRTTTGVGKTSTRTEDKGVVLKFRIQLQQRNPITRTP